MEMISIKNMSVYHSFEKYETATVFFLKTFSSYKTEDISLKPNFAVGVSLIQHKSMYYSTKPCIV